VTTGRAGYTPLETATARADVLVVDDEADVRHSAGEVLRTSGFSVEEAEDGAVALELLDKNRYGLVVLDIRMPHLDGVSLIEALVDPPPVVVHSAFALSAEERVRLGAKVVRHLRKPVSPQELLDAVHDVLGAGSDS
jgi:two-component system chemotaxis response regulator CheY